MTDRDYWREMVLFAGLVVTILFTAILGLWKPEEVAFVRKENAHTLSKLNLGIKTLERLRDSDLTDADFRKAKNIFGRIKP